MKFLKKSHPFRAVLFGIALAAATEVQAQVTKINSALIQPRVFNDVPSATLTVVTNYPSLISFAETNVTSTNGFADRDVWRFSADGGQTAYQFQPNDYFQASFSVTLTGNNPTLDKEAGFILSTTNNGDFQFIVIANNHQETQFGGISSFTFNTNFTLGNTVNMTMNYFKDVNGKNAVQYICNGASSPVFEFGPSVGSGALDIGNATLGGYFQIQTTTNSNYGTATFQNISIFPQPTLNIAENGNQSVLYWVGGTTNFTLQSSTNLASTNWTTVTNGTSITGVAVTNSSNAAFYRLIAP